MNDEQRYNQFTIELEKLEEKIRETDRQMKKMMRQWALLIGSGIILIVAGLLADEYYISGIGQGLVIGSIVIGIEDLIDTHRKNKKLRGSR